jgi:hypothetical protein
LSRDFLYSPKESEKPVFAYTALRENVSDKELENVELISSTMTGTDLQKSNLNGYLVIGSFNTSDADMGEVLLKLRRGNRLLYRAGPGKNGQSLSIVDHEQEFITQLPVANAKDWVTLEFSNAKLPDEFFVKIKDEGQGWGEWSAIAIRN